MTHHPRSSLRFAPLVRGAIFLLAISIDCLTGWAQSGQTVEIMRPWRQGTADMLKHSSVGGISTSKFWFVTNSSNWDRPTAAPTPSDFLPQCSASLETRLHEE